MFNVARVTGRPNVDWCESHKVEIIKTNIVGTLTLAYVCEQQGLLVMNFVTGCIFECDKNQPKGWRIGFKEDEESNFTESFYSKT